MLAALQILEFYLLSLNCKTKVLSLFLSIRNFFNFLIFSNSHSGVLTRYLLIPHAPDRQTDPDADPNTLMARTVPLAEVINLNF